MKEFLSAIPTFNKYQLFIIAIQFICLIVQLISFRRTARTGKKYTKISEDIFKVASDVQNSVAAMVVFRDTTFCTCESCKNRECPRKLTRLTIADAVRMGVPIRVANFMNDCSAYTEEEEGC